MSFMERIGLFQVFLTWLAPARKWNKQTPYAAPDRSSRNDAGRCRSRLATLGRPYEARAPCEVRF
jgi:hypothetical protein